MIALTLALSACGDGRDRKARVDREPPITRREFVRSEDLTDNRWQVLLATDANGHPVSLLQPDAQHQVYLEFDGGQISISGTANGMSGPFQLQPGRIVSNSMSLGMVAISNDRLSAMDDVAAEHMVPPYDYRVVGEGTQQRLYLTTRNGTQLVLQTVDAPYGSKPKMLYLEVAAEERKCEDVAHPGRLCPWVRELKPDRDEFNYSPLSDWRLLSFPIDKYRHEHGTHERLTIRHYPAISTNYGSQGSYVLDYAYDLRPLVISSVTGPLNTAPTPAPAPADH